MPKLIFLDIDGTLLPPGDMLIPDSTLQALRAARANGHKLFLCTGRNLRMTAPLLEYGCFDGAICSAGGYVLCDGQVLVDLPMEPEQCSGLSAVLEQHGVEVRVQTAIEMRQIAEPYIRSRAIRHLEKGRVVIFGCGIGCPFFSTDTAAVLRAAEIGADVILLAKNIDGVYDCDPAKNANAVKFDAITYDEVLKRRLAVMDSTATSLSMDNHIPVLVFALKDPENIIRALRGEKIGTIVKED